MNKLWLLRTREGDPDNPWNPWYDKAFGFVVRAETAEEARRFADDNAGDENRRGYGGDGSERHPWLEDDHSSCEELILQGPAGVVIRDFAAA